MPATSATEVIASDRFWTSGFGVLLLEYRGFGGNPGHPDEAGLMSDARAALAFLESAGVRPDETVLYGESLGSAVAIAVAAERADAGRPVAALVLEAPLSSVTRCRRPPLPVGSGALAAQGPVRGGEAHRRRACAASHRPWRRATRSCRSATAKALFEAARDPKEAVWILGGGHEDLSRFGLRRIVFDFLARRLPESLK